MIFIVYLLLTDRQRKGHREKYRLLLPFCSLCLIIQILLIHDLNKRHIDNNTHDQKQDLQHAAHPVGGKETGNAQRTGPWDIDAGADRHKAQRHCKVRNNNVQCRHQHKRNEHGRVQHDGKAEDDRFVNVEDAGIRESFPSSVIRFDLQNKIMAIAKDSVEPAPPKVANRSWNCWQMIWPWPAPVLKNSMFSRDSVWRMGLNTAPTTEPPFTPKNQKKCRKMYAITMLPEYRPGLTEESEGTQK